MFCWLCPRFWRFSANLRAHEPVSSAGIGALLVFRSHLGMNKLSALCVLSLGVLAFYSADSDLSLAADANSLVSPSGGTTTYFAPSTGPAAATPDTTGAIPKADDRQRRRRPSSPTPSADQRRNRGRDAIPAQSAPPATLASGSGDAATPPPPADTRHPRQPANGNGSAVASARRSRCDAGRRAGQPGDRGHAQKARGQIAHRQGSSGRGCCGRRQLLRSSQRAAVDQGRRLQP